jgi:deoxyribonucleoside regulator
MEQTRIALRAAHLYYVQHLTMETIARELATSRSSVSRLLSFAREAGLVEIQIRSPLDSSTELQQHLRSRFGVTVHTVPMPQYASDVERLERVAVTAAKLVEQFFGSDMSLGIAWGSTMSAVSRHLTTVSTRRSHVVQLNGAGNTQTTGIMYASEILRQFGDAFGARVQEFPVPAIFDDPATKEAMWRERSIRRVLDMQQRLDVALFGIGSPFSDVPSHVHKGGYLDPVDYETLESQGVVGDIATVFYRADGSWDDIEINRRSSGPRLDDLRSIPRRICVVAGRSKLESLVGALSAGMITDLVIDEESAHALPSMSVTT